MRAAPNLGPPGSPSSGSAAVGAAPAADRAEPPDLRLLLPALAVWLVALAALYLPLTPVAVASGGLVLVALVTLRRSSTLIAGVLVCAAAAGLSTSARVHARTTGPLHEAAGKGAAVTVVAVVTDDPRLVVPRAGSGCSRSVSWSSPASGSSSWRSPAVRSACAHPFSS